MMRIKNCILTGSNGYIGSHLKPYLENKQIKVIQKKIDKYGKVIEDLEKTVAILNKSAHPPIFGEKDLGKLEKRLNKLEKEK